MIYLDNAAATSKLAVNIDYSNLANPAALHSFGLNAKALLEQARAEVADFIGADPDHIIFTSGATESNSMIMECFKPEQRWASAVEHSSILRYKPSIFSVNTEGQVNIDEIRNRLYRSDDSLLLAVMLANNETGCMLMDPKDIEESKIRHNGFLLGDAAAYLPHGKIDFANSPYDAITFSGIKCHAPSGIGVLAIKDWGLPGLYKGGSAELGIRPGTPNIMGAIHLGKTLQHLKKLNNEVEQNRNLLESLLKDLGGIPVTGNRVPHILNVWFPGIPSDLAISCLSEKGVYVSGMAACDSGMNKGSSVLLAQFGNENRAKESLRFSLSLYSTTEEIKLAAQIVKDVLNEIRQNWRIT